MLSLRQPLLPWVLVVLVQGNWTNWDSRFAAVFTSAVMAMVIDHFVNYINQ